MSGKPWSGHSVVIIDDSVTVRDELKRAFEACGVKVVGLAENGVIGIDLIEKHKPELASIDVIMPEMDGIECYKRLRASFPDLKCIMVSWIAGEPKVIESLKDVIPAHAFQPKPVRAADLEARLEKIYNPPIPGKSGIKSTLEDSTFMDTLGVKAS